jgi:hypothetical protein
MLVEVTVLYLHNNNVRIQVQRAALHLLMKQGLGQAALCAKEDVAITRDRMKVH